LIYVSTSPFLYLITKFMYVSTYPFLYILMYLYSGIPRVWLVGQMPWSLLQVGATGEMGLMAFETGSTLSASQMCQRFLCKHSDLLSNRNFQAEMDELYKCPCTLDRLGLQWELVKEDKETQCYAISAVAKKRLLQTNQRNRLCCYSRETPKSNSWKDWFQSWQAGSFTGTGQLLISDPWKLSSSFSNPRAYEDAQENMQARTWCCGKSPFKFCQRFYTIFGDLQCTPYPSFVPASALGDPTIVTLDNFSYLMNGWGEYILMDVQSEEFTLQVGHIPVLFTLQVGHIPVLFTLQVGHIPVLFTLQVGHIPVLFISSYIDNQIIYLLLRFYFVHLSMAILVNGMDFTNRFYDDPRFGWSTEDISVVKRTESGKVIVAATFPCGVSIKVHVGVNSLEIDLEVDVSLRSQTKGLLGNFNGNSQDDFLLPNGTVLSPALMERQILSDFASRYLVTEATSVFIYNKRESTKNYQHPEFLPQFVDETNPSLLADAKKLCGDNNRACIYDYIATGSTNFAQNTKDGKEASDFKANSHNNTAPTVSIRSNIMIINNRWLVYEGQQNSLTVEAYDSDGDEVTYELTKDVAEVVLYQNGTLVYTSHLQAKFSLGIRARDSKGAYSPIVRIAIAVCPVCSQHGTCSTTDTQAEFLEGQFQILSCSCYPAYTGAQCESELDACKLSPCLEGQNCTDLTAAEQGNNSLGYICGPCPAGTTDVDGSCEDINECLDSTICEQDCLNTYRSYRCSCWPGFRISQTASQACIDINECEERTSSCTQVCINTEGNYTCSCQEGYTLGSDGKSCII
ncbi:unnamed protein product, partial [Candidula unifasciata]